jgi:transcriptional regulator with XRE-family HTH domain
MLKTIPKDIKIKALLSERLKLLREQNNYTQEFVAEKLGMTQSNYSVIESNGKMTVCTLYEITKIYNISMKEFFEGDILAKLESI